MQGPGCYGHNGADDAAADAAVIALRLPGQPVRVRWRREEEFGFEPVSPAMVVTVRAALDGAERPGRLDDRDLERPAHQPPGRRRQSARRRGAARPAARAAGRRIVPDAAGGAGTRNGEPLYDFPAKRIVHHLVAETPVRTSSLRGLGATLNVFAIEFFIDELAERAGQDPVAYRLSILSDPRARAVIEQAAQHGRLAGRRCRPAPASGRGIGFARYKNLAAYAAVVAEVEVDESVRLQRVWCAADAGLVINPDGAINQLEGGIIQAAAGR